MLAEDLAPNRLERAKLAIVDTIERLEGDRVALVAFAGTAVIKCPLTLDYGFFRLALSDISPESVTRGGTLIGDALRKTMDEVFDERQTEFRDVILITDGEDHESFPVEAATQMGERKIRLLAIGLGDEEQGRRIPVTGRGGRKTFLQYAGQEVWTKLDGDTLRQMVNATPGGRYLNVSTGAIDLGDVYVKLIAGARKTELGSTEIERYEEKFPDFLGSGVSVVGAGVDRSRSEAAERMSWVTQTAREKPGTRFPRRFLPPFQGSTVLGGYLGFRRSGSTLVDRFQNNIAKKRIVV